MSHVAPQDTAPVYQTHYSFDILRCIHLGWTALDHRGPKGFEKWFGVVGPGGVRLAPTRIVL